MTITAAPPSTTPEALPAVTVPSFPKAGESFANFFRARVGLDVVIGVDRDGLAAALDLHRRDLLGEAAALHRLGAEAMAAESEVVLRVARDRILLCQLFGRLRHEKTTKRIHQRSEQEILELRRGAEADPFADPADDERRLREILHPAGDAHLRLAERDRLARRHDRLEPRAAEAIHRERRHRDREAGAERPWRAP